MKINYSTLMPKTVFKLNYNCLEEGNNSRTGNCLVEPQNSLNTSPPRLIKIVNNNGANSNLQT